MINLDKKSYIASGRECHCYEHPFEPSQCIKIASDHKDALRKNKAEITYYKTLYARKVDMEYIAKYLGKVDTNMGRAYVYDCIRNSDGQISKTLKHYLLNNEGDLQQIFEQLLILRDYLLKNRILIADMHSENILIKLNLENKTLKTIIVDGLGDHSSIKLFGRIPSLAIAKVTRRWDKFINREINEKFSKSTNSSLKNLIITTNS